MRKALVRDGIIAGILGATAVALWFLGLDMIYSHAFATPAGPGRGLLRVFGPPGTEGDTTFIIAYTIFHYASFILAGLLVSVIVHWRNRRRLCWPAR